MAVSDELTKAAVKEEGKEGEEKKGDEKKTKAKDKTGEPQGTMKFRGSGFQMFLYFVLFPLTGILLFIPVPFVTVSLRNWFFKNLGIDVEGKKIDVSFAGSGLALLKYWIPSLILIIVAVVFLSLGLSRSVSGVKGFLVGFLLTDLGLLVLAPIPWLWVGKRKYIAKNLSVNLGGVGEENVARLSFNGRGLSLLGYSVLAVLSALLLFIPLPWIIVAAVKWFSRSTIVTVGKKEYRPSFSGTGGSLFWYIIGMFIASVVLVFPFVFKGLIAWFARYFNIIGLEKSVEFEFKGGAGRIYILAALEAFFILTGSILGNLIYILGKSGIISALWAIYAIKSFGVLLMLLIILVPQPFILTSLLKWQIDSTEIYIK
ncbi:MAG: hypothetical protein JW984_14725 [Deltaproteobacteria bacterium]|uniref:Uncharacterized protein n=1 Tax=Candidatus Zymogenus saltonus TaxID=2844893 RepID=A0A9D8KGV7_9DELT|nr:hypothetical protein [Candidatus Zymogenus saltonus]